MAKLTIDFKLDFNPDRIVEENIIKRGQTNLFMANTWRGLVEPFVPMREGILAHDAVEVGLDGDSGVIHYFAPYAHRQHRGEKWNSRKGYTGEYFNYSKEKHPNAGREWHKAAVQAGKMRDLERAVTQFIKRGR